MLFETAEQAADGIGIRSDFGRYKRMVYRGVQKGNLWKRTAVTGPVY